MTNQIVPIFSGGGTKLSAHIGILDAMNELDIVIENHQFPH
jgi:predicted acylesterase/phospholipase RssA